MDWATLAGYWPFVLGLMVTGVVSGVAAGLLGIGGGAIIVPALSNALLLLGYDTDVVQHVAVGTSLAIIIPTGIMSARAHYKRGALDLKVLRLWTPFIVAGTFSGGLMAGLFSGDVLRVVFAVMAFVIAANIIFAFQTRLMGHLNGSAPTHGASAFVVGYISSLMGIGGGSLTVPTSVPVRPCAVAGSPDSRRQTVAARDRQHWRLALWRRRLLFTHAPMWSSHYACSGLKAASRQVL